MPLKAFSARMFPSTITVKTVAHSSGVRGGDPATPGEGTTIAARVLENQRSARRDGQDLVVGVNQYEVTTPTDPGLATDDTVTWGTRTLAVLAPAVDMGGEGRRWRMYCAEVS